MKFAPHSATHLLVAGEVEFLLTVPAPPNWQASYCKLIRVCPKTWQSTVQFQEIPWFQPLVYPLEVEWVPPRQTHLWLHPIFCQGLISWAGARPFLGHCWRIWLQCQRNIRIQLPNIWILCLHTCHLMIVQQSVSFTLSNLFHTRKVGHLESSLASDTKLVIQHLGGAVAVQFGHISF